MPLRTFIALPVDPGPQLSRVIDQLGLIGAPLRISRTAKLHLTLRFLGDTDEALLPPLAACLDRECKSVAAMDVGLSGLGVFPDRRRPTVVWAGLQEARLMQLQQRLEESVSRLGWTREQHAYRPHVTLARINPRKPVPSELHGLLERCASRDFGTHRLDRVVLYQSESTPSGMRYTSLHEVRLAGSSE